jgi:hypothetical protein
MRYLYLSIFFLLSISLLTVLNSEDAFTQRIVNVPQGFGTLNNAIDSDTTATGERVDPNTIYELQRGGLYLLDGTIENRGYHLTIMAAEGDGLRPVIQPGVPTGGTSSQAIRARGDLTLKGLYVTNRDELGGLLVQLLRVSADAVRIVIDDCHLDEDRQSAIRLDNPNNRVFIINSIVSNIGVPWDPNNGRGIDDRGNTIDTLVIENSTFYNISSRVLRKTGGTLNYARINHNTFVNIGQYILTFDEVIEGSFTNNLIINGSFSGRAKNEGVFSWNFHGIDVKALGQDLIDAGYAQVLNIRNNNFYLDPALVAVYPDTIEATPIFNDVAQSFVAAAGTGNTLIEEAIAFTNGPPSEVGMFPTWWSDPANTPDWDRSGEPYNFAYPTTTASYTASTAGQPLGALTWFGETIKEPLPPRIVQVPQGFGTLNMAIDSDTTATGERVNPNTIYELQRGGLYLLDGTIENRGYHLTIMAAEGDGLRPVIQPGVPTGGTSSQAIRARGDLTLKGLYVTNRDELGGLLVQLLRVSADAVRIVIDDCHLDEDRQSAIRLDNPNNRVFIINSIVSNIGVPWDPNNGRGIDDRGNTIDTLVIENSTFYNISSRILRKTGGTLNYARINHNTFVNIGQYILTFDEVIEGSFTNNLIINGSFSGRAKNEGVFSWNFHGIDVKALGQDLIDAGYMQVLNIRNNNFYLNPALVAVYPDTIEATPIFNDVAQSFVAAAGTGNTLIEEAIAFTNGPPSEVGMFPTWWSDPANTPDWDRSGEPYNFAYPTTTASYTASTAGQPLGALTWFDMVVTVDDKPYTQVPNEFRLYSNYPNPFNPTTNIEFSLPEQVHVTLEIYNLLGQRVTTLIAGEMYGPGRHKVVWNGRSQNGMLVSSGVYIYRIQAGDFIDVRKMVFTK